MKTLLPNPRIHLSWVIMGTLCLFGGLLVTAAMAQPGTGSDRAADAFLQGDSIDDVYTQGPAPERDLRVQVWHDRDDDEPYRRGENLQIHFTTNDDAYVVLYRLDVDGEVEVLWPTSRYDDGFIYGNHTYTLPRPGSPVRLSASDRKGVEYIQAIASEYPFDLRELAIDFRFDLDQRERFAYQVAGDPFLAVNDINFAVTGLEEDVDWIVTDWTHLYVESKVDYARYSCTQCHSSDEGETYVHPYVDTCTTVNVYTDWGWHRRWSASFGWYPLYYDAPYYYWDVAYSRPYWFSYYPIYYSWYSYPVYARPYYVYDWHNSPWYGGDYRVRYRDGVLRHGALYDVASPGTRRGLREREAREGSRAGMPPSIARASRDARVSRDGLVRNAPPSRERRELTPRSSSSSRRGEKPGVRVSGPSRADRRVTSLTPRTRTGASAGQRPEVGSSRTGERRWTRPVIRNSERERGRDRSNDRSYGDPPRTPSRDRSSTVDRPRTPSRRSGDSGVDRTPTRRQGSGDVERPSPPTRRSSPDRVKTPTRRKSGSGGESEARSPRSSRRSGSDSKVSPPSRSSNRGGGSKATPTPRSSKRSGGSKATPAPRSSKRSGGSKATPPPRSSNRSGGSKATPSRGSKSGGSGSGKRGGGGRG